ncbi:MAG: hypothetical protein ABSA74_00315 [Candidatus Staskawiczbacteria bacterium]|jgi:hypothetical protein
MTNEQTIKQWQPREKTAELIVQTEDILKEYSVPLTVRQLYYRLVAKQIIENNSKSYKNLDVVLTKARKNGYLAFDAFTDRVRKPIRSGSWSDLKDFIASVKRSYVKDKWENQEEYVEVWLEKDALAGIFEPITQRYDVNLLVGRGYQSLSAINEAVRRFPKKPVHILYFGDFDPTGKDIPRNAIATLKGCFGISPTFETVSLTREEISKYRLPPALTKKSDSRSKKFVKAHGDIAVELDALPPDVLEKNIIRNIQKYLDVEQFKKDLAVEKAERKELNQLQIEL